MHTHLISSQFSESSIAAHFDVVWEPDRGSSIGDTPPEDGVGEQRFTVYTRLHSNLDLKSARVGNVGILSQEKFVLPGAQCRGPRLVSECPKVSISVVVYEVLSVDAYAI